MRLSIRLPTIRRAAEQSHEQAGGGRDVSCNDDALFDRGSRLLCLGDELVELIDHRRQLLLPRQRRGVRVVAGIPVVTALARLPLRDFGVQPRVGLAERLLDELGLGWPSLWVDPVEGQHETVLDEAAQQFLQLQLLLSLLPKPEPKPTHGSERNSDDARTPKHAGMDRTREPPHTTDVPHD